MRSKKLFFTSTIAFCIMILNAPAQKNAYLVLEYMKVKPGNEDKYLSVEKDWKKIHLQRLKDSTISHWSVWQVVAPYNMNADYQYVVATIYPRFSDYLEPFKNIEVSKIFTGITEDSVGRIFTKTGEARDMLSASVYEILAETGFPDHTPKYLLATTMKATPGKEGAYESLEMKDWLPIHKDLAKRGFESGFSFGRLMFPADNKMTYNYSIFRFFDNAAMFDKQDQIKWQEYRAANIPAFDNAEKLRTEMNTQILTLVESSDPDKAK